MKVPIQILKRGLCLGAALSFLTGPALAQTVLFSDTFDTDTSGNWTVTSGSGNGTPDFTVLFSFNYQTNKFVRNGLTNTIPPAPNGGGNGVKMWVNKNDAVADIAAVSLYPTGKIFSNDYALKFDMWLNYNGGFQGGSGSTEFGTFGINHVGDKVNWSDNPGSVVTNLADGVFFAVTGEAGAALDYRSFVGDNASTAIRSQGAAGGFLDRNGDSSVEEEVFDEPEDLYPLKQMFPRPTFETPGVPGKQWVEVEIRQRTNELGGHIVTWLMNNYVIAEHSAGDSVNMTNGNVMIGNMDIFSSIASPAADNYVIYDNVRVVDLSGVPTNEVVTVTASDDTATESPPGDNGEFVITRSGPAVAPLTVFYRMVGTASNGVDYVSPPGVAVLAAGQTSSNITIVPINDLKGENTETVVLCLIGNTNYSLYNNVSAVVNLVDDNDKPLATVTAFRKAAYEANPGTPAEIQVDFSNPFISDVTVNYSLTGTAVNGTHYTNLPTSFVMAAGQTTQKIFITPIDDGSTVSNRTVIFTLQNGVNYSNAAPSNATVTIFNDDLSPAVLTLFADNFDVDSSANWNTNRSNANCDAIFAFDYGTAAGIPSAPHSVGGTTLGLRVRANSPSLGAAAQSAMTCSPKNQSFTNDFRLRFDWWPNFPGPFPGGGAGSTQLGSCGITRGTIPQSQLQTSSDSVFFSMSGDGGTAPDVRVYTNASSPINPTTALGNGVYAAGNASGSNNEEDSYYSIFGRVAAPAAQQGINGAQTGLTAVGAPGEAWHDVVVTKRGNSLTWVIDGLRIATLNAETFGITLSTNIFVGQAEINAGQTSVALDEMQCGIFDNVKVEALALPTVAITTISIVGTNAVIDFTGGVEDPAVAYTLQQAATVDGVFSINNAAVVTAGATPGAFRATVPASGAAAFYRVRR